MTYFGFHLRFLVPAILLLGLLLLRDTQRGIALPAPLRVRPAWIGLLAHVALAVIWTTPWDNYLVATRVWWYDPARVTGLTLGWVPIEEYTFFVLQTVLTGLWLLWLARRIPAGPAQPAAEDTRPRREGRFLAASWSLPRPARWPLAALAVTWLGALAVLLAGWQPGTYLALELIWLLPPMAPQVAIGTRALWQRRRLVGAALLGAVAYLSVADAIAIRARVWTINPSQTTGLLLAGILPVEEFVFFILTNALIVFGMTLFISLSPLPRALRNLVRVPEGKREAQAQ